MNLEHLLVPLVKKAVKELYGQDISEEAIQFQKTRKDFEGDITLVVFPLVRISKKSPVDTGQEIGAKLADLSADIPRYNTIQGFLNLVIADAYWLSQLAEISSIQNYGTNTALGSKLMVEYSSPNTNKPLHLGHLRNNFLGNSVARILQANGHQVIKTQIINDRGIHICKSMLAWKLFGKGETPYSAQMKGDKLVGKYYVLFDQVMKKETEIILAKWEQGDFGDASESVQREYEKLAQIASEKTDDKGAKAVESKIKKLANNSTAIMHQVQDMLLKWEAKDPEVYALWEMMNGWVYEGFDVTYKNMGVDFDKLYYESDTYLTGKEVVEEGLAKGVFYKKEDGSVWIDLTADGLDEKIVLRADGTAVYMTQDIGTAIQRMKDFNPLKGIVYTVGNEQDYHFKVLFLILEKLGYKWAKNCYHLSYGMVDLRNKDGQVGKMKSREGTVVDADELIMDVVSKAKEMTEERGQIEHYSATEKETLFKMIGLAGLKYYLLKVDPTKSMTFNPEESVELNGNTGPFIQYAHARIQSLLRKADQLLEINTNIELEPVEKELIKIIVEYPMIVEQAGNEYSPAVIANYTYELAKTFNSFFQSISIFREESETIKNMRLQLSKMTANTIKSGMNLLGIEVPNRM
jgi:arginyl-tRNA synthetase